MSLLLDQQRRKVPMERGSRGEDNEGIFVDTDLILKRGKEAIRHRGLLKGGFVVKL